MALVDSQIGNFGRPAHVWFVSQLPKTRSGKCCAARSRRFAKDAILEI
ncbi:AMP-binding enzyme [Escherichia coli]